MICLTFLDDEDAWRRYTAQNDSECRCGFITYAAKYWISHTAAVGEQKTNLIHRIKHFFGRKNKNFDFWVRQNQTNEANSDEDWRKERGTATPLYYAALLDLPKAMDHVLVNDEAQLDKVGGNYGTPLQAVCFKGYETAVKKLLEWGADPDVEGGEFGVPINAAITGGHRGIVKALLDIGIENSLKDPLGRTPLYTAAKSGDFETLCSLVKAGAKTDTRDDADWTPLHSAANGGHLEVVKLLLEKKADVAATNSDGRTRLYLAVTNGHLEVVNLLLEKGADVTATNSGGCTPLHSAAESCQV